MNSLTTENSSAPSALKLLAVAGLAVCACRQGEPPLFELLSLDETGISFVNQLPDDTVFNILNYLYYYNGGGVAAGDINGDGLPDLYFTSNRGSDRLYLNRGDYRFEDITERAGVSGPEGWSSGVTMADVNGDGHLDIYVSAVHHLGMRGRNVLYLNNADLTFTERAEEYGLAHAGYSTQALFADFDADGDLDMYLLNHSLHTERGPSREPQRQPRHPRAGDRLYRNDGSRFTEVSDAAGIYGGVEGYGLGVVASDLNLDGCLDLFVANDFQEDDFLYRNDCDGTFTESITTSLWHTSQASMGVDAADFNNDGRPDLVVLDMLPEREEILKTSASAESFNVYDLKRQAGYHPQLGRNTLQLNRGAGRFSDIAYLAGVHATDWSWAPLFADLDNDGYKDLFVTNGVYRRPNDLDYLAYVRQPAVQMALMDGVTEETLSLLDHMPRVPIPNAAYRNQRNLRFASVAEPWGLAEPGFSSGAAYADLNNSGALDLVVNNINAPASVYRNRSREINGHHFLRVVLRGAGANTAGLGARVTIRHDGMTQMLELVPTRGFQSSVDPRLHFGLSGSMRVDSLVVVWPGRRFQVLTDLAADQTVTVSELDAVGQWRPPEPPTPLLADVTARVAADYRHGENVFYDYHREPLIPHQLSTEGPALAVGDVNGDGRDDLYAGGAKWQPGRLLLRRAEGGFAWRPQPAFVADSLAEDVDAALFDVDGDGDLDLYVVSGGNEFWGQHEALRHRLYLNDGAGNFTRASDRLPAIFENGGCVVPADFDGDRDIDVFVGGRVVSRGYGQIPRSFLLENDGEGRLTDVTTTRAPALHEAGMVSSAVWLDQDGDGRLDLAVVGEWMPIRLFRQEQGRFVERTAEAGLAGTEGWWSTVTAADLDGDGRDDLVLGNLGWNSYLRASPEQPLRLYLADFAHTGGLQPIFMSYRNGMSYPLAGRDELIELIPRFRDRYPSYAAYGASRIEDMFSSTELRRATVREAYLLASVVALNRPDRRFEIQPLPVEAQFAPIYSALAGDLDGDTHVDLLLAGNFFGVPPLRGRYDASYGLLLRGNGAGGFTSVDLTVSGLVLEGQVRDLEWVRGASGERLIVAARNNERLQIIRPVRRGGPS